MDIYTQIIYTIYRMPNLPPYIPIPEKPKPSDPGFYVKPKSNKPVPPIPQKRRSRRNRKSRKNSRRN
jgi:hypothetical protein